MHRLNQVPQASIKFATSFAFLACAIAMCGCTKMRPPEFAKLLEQNAFTDEFTKPAEVNDRELLQQAINSSENAGTPSSRRQEPVDLELDRSNGMRQVSAKQSTLTEPDVTAIDAPQTSHLLVNLPEPTPTSQTSQPVQMPTSTETLERQFQKRSAAKLLHGDGNPLPPASIAETKPVPKPQTQPSIILKTPPHGLSTQQTTHIQNSPNQNSSLHDSRINRERPMTHSLPPRGLKMLEPAVTPTRDFDQVRLASRRGVPGTARHQLDPIRVKSTEMPAVDPELMLLPIPVSQAPKATPTETIQVQTSVTEKATEPTNVEFGASQTVESNVVGATAAEPKPAKVNSYDPQTDLVIPAAPQPMTRQSAVPSTDDTNQFAPMDSSLAEANPDAALPSDTPATNAGEFVPANDFVPATTSESTIHHDLSSPETPAATCPSTESDATNAKTPCCTEGGCAGCPDCNLATPMQNMPPADPQDHNHFEPIQSELPAATPDCPGCESFDCSSVIPPFAEAPEQAIPFQPMVTRTPLKQREFQAIDFIASSSIGNEAPFPTSQATFIAPEAPANSNAFQPAMPPTAGDGDIAIERQSNFEPKSVEVSESEEVSPPAPWQQEILESIDAVIDRLKSDAENSETAPTKIRTESRIDFLSTTRRELELFRGDAMKADSAWQLKNAALLDVVKIQLAGQNHPETKSALKVLLNRLEKQAPLKLVNASFCTKVKGFGQFTPDGNQSFAPGQQSLLYCEIENFVTDEDVERGFRTRLSGGFMVTNEVDEIVQQANFAPVDDFANRPRRDFYIHLPITVGELEPGQYTLQLIITDHVGNKSASLGEPLKFDVR